MSTSGLNVNNIVNVQVNISPSAVAVNGLNIMMCVGDSDVINGVERYRIYSNLLGVANDFGTTAPEYYAAQAYYAQSPQPNQIMIGRWLRTATSGFITGGALTATEQEMSNWTSITTGSFTIGIDGSTQDLLGLDFSAEVTLNGVATVITGGLSGAICTWNGSQFVITSSSTGVLSLVSYATPEGTGFDISGQLMLTSTTANVPIPGFAAEEPIDAIIALDNMTALWYFLMFNCSVQPTTNQNIAVAGYIESDNILHLFGINTQDPNTLISSYTTDIASQLKSLEYERSCVQYSSTSQVAIASLLGRNASVNFNGNLTAITDMFKQEPGIVGEVLTQNQAAVLQTKNCNVFVEYQNGTFIIQYGTMAYNIFIDIRHGVDWLAQTIQTNCFNLLYTSTTKIPQTDAGNNQIVTAITQALQQGVTNGVLAPGVWNAAGFGTLNMGDSLPLGYYIFCPPIATQNQSDREARKSVTIQIAAKLAGAIQSINVILNVNR